MAEQYDHHAPEPADPLSGLVLPIRDGYVCPDVPKLHGRTGAKAYGGKDNLQRHGRSHPSDREGAVALHGCGKLLQQGSGWSL